VRFFLFCLSLLFKVAFAYIQVSHFHVNLFLEKTMSPASSTY